MQSFAAQTLHIFRKDIRGLRLYLLPALAMTALFALAGALRAAHPLDATLSDSGAILNLLLLVAWGILIGQLVQAESLTSDRHFWLTRPYAWPSLLAAKLLFIAAFILLPKLLADIVILAAYGFAPLPLLPGLLARLVAITLFDLLPLAFAAAITPNFLAYSLTACSAAGLLFSLRFVSPLLLSTDPTAPRLWTVQYTASLALALACAALLVWQYARRRILRALAGALAALVVFPLLANLAFSWTSQFAIESHLAVLHPRPGAITVSADPQPRFRNDVTVRPDGGRNVEFMLKIHGAPAGTVPVLEGARITLETPAGTLTPDDSAPWRNVGASTRRTDQLLPLLHFSLDAARWRALAGQPVTLRGTAYIALYGWLRYTQIAQPDQPYDLQDAARCGLYQAGTNAQPVLICQSPLGFRPGQLMATVNDSGISFRNGMPLDTRGRLNEAPVILSTAFDPLQFSDEIDPVSEIRSYRSTSNDNQPLVGFQQPLGFVAVDFAIPSIPLARLAPQSANAVPPLAVVHGHVSYDGPALLHGVSVTVIDAATYRIHGFPGFLSCDHDCAYSIPVRQAGTYYVVAAPFGEILLLEDGFADREMQARIFRAARKIVVKAAGENFTVDLKVRGASGTPPAARPVPRDASPLPTGAAQPQGPRSRAIQRPVRIAARPRLEESPFRAQ